MPAPLLRDNLVREVVLRFKPSLPVNGDAAASEER